MIGIGQGGRLLVLSAALALATGCGETASDKAGGQHSPRKTIVLTLANPLGDASELDGFASEVRRLSGGAIVIEVKSGWRHGQVAYQLGLIGDVRAGRADLGVVASRIWDAVGVDSLRALVAPFLINSYALQDRVLRSPLVPQMLEGLAPLGLVGLGVLPSPLRYPLGVARPLLKPSDYSGLRIGLNQSSVGRATLRAFGGTPVDISAGGSIAGLGGVEQDISSIFGSDYERTGRYLTANVPLWPRPLVVFASRAAFAKLTDTQRRIISQAALDAIPAESGSEIETQSADTAALCKSGLVRFVSATGRDLSALRRAVEPVYAVLDRDKQTRAFIAQIEAMRTGVAPQDPLSCAPTASSSATDHQLDGVYQYSVTYADLKAVGAGPSELTPTNVGKTTFVIDRGHFAMTIENAHACMQAFGPLSVTSNELVLHFFADGPGGPGAVPDLFTFRWSLYRDVLSVRRAPGGVSPSNGLAKPWRRVSTTPSLQYFSQRCPAPPQAVVG